MINNKKKSNQMKRKLIIALSCLMIASTHNVSAQRWIKDLSRGIELAGEVLSTKNGKKKSKINVGKPFPSSPIADSTILGRIEFTDSFVDEEYGTSDFWIDVEYPLDNFNFESRCVCEAIFRLVKQSEVGEAFGQDYHGTSINDLFAAIRKEIAITGKELGATAMLEIRKVHETKKYFTLKCDDGIFANGGPMMKFHTINKKNGTIVNYFNLFSTTSSEVLDIVKKYDSEDLFHYEPESLDREYFSELNVWLHKDGVCFVPDNRWGYHIIVPYDDLRTYFNAYALLLIKE